MRPIVELETAEMSMWSASMHTLMYHHPPLPPLPPETMEALEKCRADTEIPPPGKHWRGTGCAMEN